MSVEFSACNYTHSVLLQSTVTYLRTILLLSLLIKECLWNSVHAIEHMRALLSIFPNLYNILECILPGHFLIAPIPLQTWVGHLINFFQLMIITRPGYHKHLVEEWIIYTCRSTKKFVVATNLVTCTCHTYQRALFIKLLFCGVYMYIRSNSTFCHSHSRSGYRHWVPCISDFHKLVHMLIHTLIINVWVMCMILAVTWLGNIMIIDFCI